jgi:ABC-2 type transport system permease protein
MKLKPGSWLWLLKHELRLSFRNGTRKTTWKVVVILGLLLWAAFHLAAFGLLVGATTVKLPPIVTAIVGLSVWFMMSMMLSQSIMQSVNVLFDRGDLDLLMSSPLSPRTVLIVRTLGIAVFVITFYFFLTAPFAHVGLFLGKFHLLAIYPALISLGLLMTSMGMLLTLTLVRLLGARRARVTAQVMAAFMGAILFLLSQAQVVVGKETAAKFGALFRANLEPSGWLAPDSLLWLPLRAFMGDPVSLLILTVAGVSAYLLIMQLTYRRFLHSTQESVTGSARKRNVAITAQAMRGYFRPGLFRNVLRKEWRMVLRDPNLIAQTLLQVLYLLPLFFVAFQGVRGARIEWAIPGVIFLAGSLVGSLAWLMVAAEDAPELVGAAPVQASRIRWMKAFAAMLPVLALVAPIILATMWLRPWWGLSLLFCVVGAALSAGALQVFYPRQGSRKDMAKRYKGNFLPGLLETLALFGWAGTALALVSGPGMVWWLVPVGLMFAAAGPYLAWSLGEEQRAQGMLVSEAK